MGFSSQVGALIVAGLFSFGGCAMSALACDTLSPGPKGRVVEITDGDTLILDNSQKVRLIGMQAPKLPLGRIGFETWPLAAEAKDFFWQSLPWVKRCRCFMAAREKTDMDAFWAMCLLTVSDRNGRKRQ